MWFKLIFSLNTILQAIWLFTIVFMSIGFVDDSLYDVKTVY